MTLITSLTMPRTAMAVLMICGAGLALGGCSDFRKAIGEWKPNRLKGVLKAARCEAKLELVENYVSESTALADLRRMLEVEQEDEDGDVFAFVTAVGMHAHRDAVCLQQVRKFVLSQLKDELEKSAGFSVCEV